MKRRLRQFFALILLVVLVVGLINYKMVDYGLAQLRGQLKIVWNAVEVEELLVDPQVADSVKTKLILIQKIRKFSFDSLGLHFSRNYTTVYDHKGEPPLWVLSAAPPFELTAYEWYFPVLGHVSYKGFFNKERGEEELEEMKRNGYDTEFGPAGGWSTLGWFRDPILSRMLKLREGDLANIIIHELTHQTLYVPDSVDFNENLASFIGDKGARKFLEAEFGEGSVQYQQYVMDLHDDSLYNAVMVKGALRLDSLYKTFSSTMPDEKKAAMKSELIEDIIKDLGDLPFYDAAKYQKYAGRARKAGNAFFMGYVRYSGQQPELEEEFRNIYGGSIRRYIEALAEKYPSL